MANYPVIICTRVTKFQNFCLAVWPVLLELQAIYATSALHDPKVTVVTTRSKVPQTLLLYGKIKLNFHYFHATPVSLYGQLFPC